MVYGFDEGPIPFVVIEEIDEGLNLRGESFQIKSVGLYMDADSGHLGRTIFFSNQGNNQLSSHWVPFDPRSPNGGKGGITFPNDLT